MKVALNSLTPNSQPLEGALYVMLTALADPPPPGGIAGVGDLVAVSECWVDFTQHTAVDLGELELVEIPEE